MLRRGWTRWKRLNAHTARRNGTSLRLRLAGVETCQHPALQFHPSAPMRTTMTRKLTDEEARVLAYVTAHRTMYGAAADLESIALCAKVGDAASAILGELERLGLVVWYESDFSAGYSPVSV